MERAAMTIRAAIAALAAFWSTGAVAYDDSWYRLGGWPGEYPAGLTLARDVTVDIRSAPDPDLVRAVSCALRRGATYHPWNLARAEADGLEFVAFSRIVPYEVTSPLTTYLYRESDGSEEVVDLAPGRRWEYLGYLAEGAFLLRLDGEVYQGQQDLVEASTETPPGTEPGGDALDQWMKLTCANGATGWLLISDVADAAGFDSPQITGYGYAADRE